MQNNRAKSFRSAFLVLNNFLKKSSRSVAFSYFNIGLLKLYIAHKKYSKEFFWLDSTD